MSVSLLLGLAYLISESRKGIAEIEGKTTRAGASECGQGASFNPESKKSNQESRKTGIEIVVG
jgi:hypothetical protein